MKVVTEDLRRHQHAVRPAESPSKGTGRGHLRSPWEKRPAARFSEQRLLFGFRSEVGQVSKADTCTVSLTRGEHGATNSRSTHSEPGRERPRAFSAEPALMRGCTRRDPQEPPRHGPPALPGLSQTRLPTAENLLRLSPAQLSLPRPLSPAGRGPGHTHPGQPPHQKEGHEAF